MQRPLGPVCHDRRLGGPGIGHRQVFGQMNKGVQLFVQLIHPLEASAGQLDRRELFGRNQAGGLGNRRNRAAHARSSSAKS